MFEKIKIPNGVKLEIKGNKIFIEGKEGKVEKQFNLGNIEMKTKNDEIIVGNKSATKSEKKMIYTIVSHINNLIQGVEKKYEYQLKICFNHFPMTIDLTGNEATIKNFLGETIPRKATVLKDVNVKINKDIITITSLNKESAGQTAANFETATKIRNRDRRVFQDGIFIINKCGKEI